MVVEKRELESQLIRLTALLEAKTAEMHQIDGAKAFCEHLLSVCDKPAEAPAKDATPIDDGVAPTNEE